MKKDRYIKTANLNLAVFLYSNNQQIAGVDAVTPDHKEFSFIKSDYIEELVWLYKFGEKDDDRLTVQVHKYEQARRELLDRLND